MLDFSTYRLFIIASLTLLIVPGPAVLYIVARSIEQGRISGIVSVFGIGLGSLFHVLAAALGLSAILMSSALAFAMVKYLGAAYLIYLGIRTLRSSSHQTENAAFKQKPLYQIFYQGAVVNILNPKTALFFFAFLPQFVFPERGAPALQIIMLGIVFTAMAIVTDSIYAISAGSLGNWIQRNPSYLRKQRVFSGMTYLFLGCMTALSGTKSK